jgi:putative FmdB family regulatory protein
MPIFEYRCTKCGTVYEETVTTGRYVKLESLPESQPIGCPLCGSISRELLLSAPALIKVK